MARPPAGAGLTVTDEERPVNVLHLVVVLILVVAAVAVLQWFVSYSGVNIPKPVMIVLYAAVAILAILFLAGLAGVGPGVRLN